MNPTQKHTSPSFCELSLTMDEAIQQFCADNTNIKMCKYPLTEEKKAKSPKQTKTNHKVKTTAVVDKKQAQKKKQADASVEDKKSARQNTKTKLKFHENDGDNSSDEEWEDESEYTDDEEEEEYVLDEAMYTSLLNQLFPSAYSKERAEKANKAKKNAEKKTKQIDAAVEGEDHKTVRTRPATRSTMIERLGKPSTKPVDAALKNTKSKKSAKDSAKKKNILEEVLDTEESTSVDEDESSDDSDYEEELKQLLSGKGLQKFNIIFEIGGDEYDDETDDSDDEEDDSEDDSDDEVMDEDDFKDYTKNDYERDLKLLEEFNKMSSNLEGVHKNSAVLNFMNDEAKYLKKSVEKYQLRSEKKERKEHMKQFKKISSGNKKRFNDKLFFEQRTLEEQHKILQQMEEVYALVKIDTPYKFKLLETDIPLELKACAMKKIEMFKYMDTGMSEYYKLKNWIDTFMEIPFGQYKGLPVTLDDGMDACRDFMTQAKETLDNVAFGLDDAKMQIIQMIGTWITNPDAIGSAIAIQGPPGTGKTTLVKEGISKILGRDFAFIALGGATDSSFLEGHSYTYEGSKWGKIVDILVQIKSMNPIIYFDELDKISDTPKGEEIIGILTHLTDTTQNSSFHDKYFSEIEFDLSKCLFIFSYNDESKINPILKDRMYRIYTQGYTKTQKQSIARNYLMPKIMDTVKFGEDEVIIDDDIIDYINMKYVDEEKGVRNMKRSLEIIYMKLNLFRFIDSDSRFFDEQGTDSKETKTKVEFPLRLTNQLVDKLLKRNKIQDGIPHIYM